MRAMRSSPRIPIIPSIGMVKMFSYLDVIVIYYKKIPEIPETQKSGTCVLKVHKNLGTCVFLGGGWPGSIRTIMFFFWAGGESDLLWV